MAGKARDIMQTEVKDVLEDMYVNEVAKLFVELEISGAPVVNTDGKLVGVVSETDMVRLRGDEETTNAPTSNFYGSMEALALSEGFHVELPDRKRVKEIMTPVVIQADEERSVQELAKLMVRKRIHRIIITKNSKLAGIVTTMDVLQYFSELELGEG